MIRQSQEHQEQVAVFDWAGFATGRWPELALLYAIPNGGERHPAVAVRLKAEGMKAGVPDLCLPVARGGYHGLYIELKRPAGRLSPKQRHWLLALEREGYRAAMVRGWSAAQRLIEDYLAAGVTKR